MKGYQFLENDFFSLCKTREIGATPMLIYIYLRGLYCRFQKPDFFVSDKIIREDLSISQSTLARAREFLQTRGVISYQSGKGAHRTIYTMLGTVLLPIVKKTIRSRQTKRTGCRQNDDTNNTIYERLNNPVGIGEVFKGISKEERIDLQAIGLLRSDDVSLKRKG